ncbi:MAG TPA: response regulator [Bacillota bacterium]|nr:response regulator [Bacillota bacterium]
MFKILIVDDERTTRDSLREVFSWEQLNITTVLIAKNGVEALELLKENQPDILLTDVRMPKMDGLELAEHARRIYPNCKIIFLSGYADKDYLKKAIHLKAVNYIEKPINPDEIKAVIQEAVALCLEEYQKNQQMIQIQNTLAQRQPYLRQALVLDLIQGSTVSTAARIAQLTAKYPDIFSKILPDHRYQVAYLSLHWKPGLEGNSKEQSKEALLQLFSAPTPGFSLEYLAGFDELGNLILIIPVKIGVSPWGAASDTIGFSGPTNLFRSVLGKVREIAADHFTTFIGIGTDSGDIDQIPESYRSAVTAAAYQFYLGSNQIYSYNAINDTPFQIERHQFHMFKEYLNKDNQEAAEELVRQLTDQALTCMDRNIDRVKNIYFHLLMVVFEVALERELIDPFGKDEKSYFWQEIDGKRTLKELSEYVITSIQGIFSRLDEQDGASRKAYEIMRFIRENFADKELSIQTIGAHIYISPTYLCAFFKKTTGKTINEFITEVRIEKAKQLLKDSRVKLYEVSTSIGFTDVNYFSTLFKRNVGCTPSEFRGRR